MPRNYKADPYCVFKDDRERRRALIVRELSKVLMVVVIAATQTNLPEALRRLTTWFR
jgi:hypothetical protein